MQPHTATWPRWILSLIMLAVIGFGTLQLFDRGKGSTHETADPIRLSSGTLIPNPHPMQPFHLIDHNGKPFSNESIKGAWHLLSFGYTHCPDVCPTTLAMLARLADQLRKTSTRGAIKTAFVTIDPARDTQPVLAKYVPYFDSAFLGVTGEPQELDKLTRQLGVLYARVENEKSDMGYLMDHSTSIILTNPQGQFQALFSAPHDVVAMAQDLEKIRNP